VPNPADPLIGVDRGWRSHAIGDPVVISIAASEAVSATHDFQTGGTQQQIALGNIAAGATRTNRTTAGFRERGSGWRDASGTDLLRLHACDRR
jgi:hypothetical protein